MAKNQIQNTKIQEVLWGIPCDIENLSKSHMSGMFLSSKVKVWVSHVIFSLTLEYNSLIRKHGEVGREGENSAIQAEEDERTSTVGELSRIISAKAVEQNSGENIAHDDSAELHFNGKSVAF